MSKHRKFNLKPHHFHFAHGWLWGVAFLGAVLLIISGVRGGYFRYWFGGDFKVVNVHEVVQSAKESEVLFDAMRANNIVATVLVGTPNEIIYYTGESGFSGYEQNNNEILDVQESNPKRFMAFCTFDPADPEYMTTVETCIEEGAMGFKLYAGHSFFYDKPLDDESLYPFYSAMEENQLPLIFHVNSAKYQEEFENVLTLYPDMQVICPHFCLTSKNLQRLSYLFDTYPNLKTDISFGSESYFFEGIARISESPEAYREFIIKYADRFFYGTDVVVTDYEGKDEVWLTALFRAYRDLLEKETFVVELGDNPAHEYNGLALDEATLKKIYETNWEDLWDGESATADEISDSDEEQSDVEPVTE